MEQTTRSESVRLLLDCILFATRTLQQWTPWLSHNQIHTQRLGHSATFGLFEIDVWWELASLITIMVLGHWLEMRAISQARGALNALAALLPDTAERVKGAETESVPLSANGLLVKDRLALKRARNLDLVIFDKTGTLTRGSPAVSGIAAAPGTTENDLIARAAAVESNSEHPLAKAIVAEAKRRSVAQPSATNFEALAGRGAKALVEGKVVEIGGPRLLTEANVAVPPEVEKLANAWASDGKTVLYAVAQGQLLGAFAVEDEIRPESSEAVTELHRLGIRVAMITGDSKAVADSVARRIGIDEVAAEVLPFDKAAAVRNFQTAGKRVAMVGDGVNDAPALATANVGIAIGAGTDVAIESAGIVLVRSDPRDVVGAIELSRGTYRKMIQNLVWAAAYNLVAIPVAGGLFVHWGLDLPMSVGAVAMSLSTIIVAANAQLLRRLKSQHDTLHHA